MLAQDIAKCDPSPECGVIDAYVDTFAAHLTACGYALGTIQSQLKLLGLFNDWLICRRCVIHQLNDQLVAAFLKRCTRRERTPERQEPIPSSQVQLASGGSRLLDFPGSGRRKHGAET